MLVMQRSRTHTNGLEATPGTVVPLMGITEGPSFVEVALTTHGFVFEVQGTGECNRFEEVCKILSNHSTFIFERFIDVI